MQKTKRKNCIRALILTGLIAVLTSCTTIEYVYVVPELDFPEFPICEKAQLEEDETVKIDLDFFIGLAEFKIDYQALINYYTKMKEKEI